MLLRESSRTSMLEEMFNDAFRVLDVNLKSKNIPVNIKEVEDGYQIEVVAPGFDRKDFYVKLEEGNLSVSSSKEESSGDFIKREYVSNSFERSFKLPDDVNGEDIKAKYENGILNLELSKEKVAKKSPKSIEVL